MPPLTPIAPLKEAQRVIAAASAQAESIGVAMNITHDLVTDLQRDAAGKRDDVAWIACLNAIQRLVGLDHRLQVRGRHVKPAGRARRRLGHRNRSQPRTVLTLKGGQVAASIDRILPPSIRLVTGMTFHFY